MKITNGKETKDLEIPTLNVEGELRMDIDFERPPRKMFVDIKYGPKPKNAAAYRDKEWLIDQYTKAGRSMASIANQFGVSPMTIQTWLRKHDIETRNRGRRKHYTN